MSKEPISDTEVLDRLLGMLERNLLAEEAAAHAERGKALRPGGGEFFAAKHDHMAFGLRNALGFARTLRSQGRPAQSEDTQ